MFYGTTRSIDDGWQEKTIFRFYENILVKHKNTGPKNKRARNRKKQLRQNPLLNIKVHYKLKSYSNFEDFDVEFPEKINYHRIKILSIFETKKYVGFDDIIDNVYNKNIRNFVITVKKEFQEIFERDILINLFEPSDKIYSKCNCGIYGCCGFVHYIFDIKLSF
jgi:hypothetical protein